MAGSKELFQQAMNQGHSAAWDQQWEQAASLYQKALVEFPDNPQALTNLGLALFELQQFESSLQCYVKVAKMLPDDPVPMEKIAQLFERIGKIEQAQTAAFHAAEIYLRNKEIQKAIENWQRVAYLNPENLRARMRLAIVYERLGEKQAAVAQNIILASLYQQADDMEKAVKSVKHALEIQPDSSEAFDALALLKDNQLLPKPERPKIGTAPLRMSQVRQMEVPLEGDEAKEGLDPVGETRQKALTMLAGMLFELTDEEPSEHMARRGLQSIVRGTGSLRPMKAIDRTRIMLHLSQVIDLQSQGDVVQAADEMERAIEAGLDHPAAFFNLGLLRVQTNRLESAIRYLQHSINHPEFALGSRLLIGKTLHRMGRMKEAGVEFLSALSLADMAVVPAQHREDLRQLYEPIIEAQNLEIDIEAQQRVCDNVSDLLTRPNWRENLSNARKQLASRVDGDVPIPLAEVLLQARSSQVVESLTKISELARAGHLRSAMEVAFYGLQQAPTYLPLHAYMGELLLKQGRTEEAIAKLRVVAETYSARGDARRAVDLFHRIIELTPMDLNARNRLIDLLVDIGKIEEALNEYLEFANIYYSMADLEMVRSTYTEALRLAQQSNLDRSWRVKILHRMADLDLQSLDWRKAVRLFEQIRTIQPDDEKSRAKLIEINLRLGQEAVAHLELDNYLAYLLDRDQLKNAIGFLESLTREQPGRAGLHSRLASLYERAGRKADSIVQLDKIGEILLEAGDRSGAIQTVERILTLKPENVKDYQALLKQLKEGNPAKLMPDLE